MGRAAVLAECEHEDAMLIDDVQLHHDFQGKTYFFCPLCGVTLDDEGQDVGYDPTEAKEKTGASHRPKAVAPLKRKGNYKGGMPGRSWSKDQTGRILISCQWANCQAQLWTWPGPEQALKRYCLLHRAEHKWRLLRDRQKRWWGKHRSSKT